MKETKAIVVAELTKVEDFDNDHDFVKIIGGSCLFSEVISYS